MLETLAALQTHAAMLQARLADVALSPARITPPLIGADASSIAAAVKAGRTTAQAVIRRTLDRIAAADGALNAFTAVFASEALEAASRLDGQISRGEPSVPWPARPSP